MLSLVRVGTAVTCTRTGLVAPMVKELTDRLSLVLLLLSVTAMVQLLYVPSSRFLKVTVLLPTEDELSELLQLPPYVMSPASVDEKV